MIHYIVLKHATLNSSYKKIHNTKCVSNNNIVMLLVTILLHMDSEIMVQTNAYKNVLVHSYNL